MKRRSLWTAAIAAFFTFLAAFFSVCAEEQEAKQLHVVFSHDIHSHLDTFPTVEGDTETMIGGMGRMMTFIQQEKESSPDTLLLDGGDFSMGTVYQMLYETEAPELRMFGYLGYDAVTIGNHEFDYGSEGLARMLKRAAKSGEALPEFVLCNVKWKKQLNQEQQMLKNAFEEYGIKPYTMIQKGDVRIAVIGVFGEDALECVPSCALEFEDPVKAVKRTVKKIQDEEEADLIVCLSHSGTTGNPETSEDEILAEEVPELDLIVSGHTHTKLKQPIKVGNTAIVSCGEYGKQMGKLDLVQKEDGRWEIRDYELVSMNNEFSSDQGVLERLEQFSELIDREYLSVYGFTRDMVLCENPYLFATKDDLYKSKTENNLGNLVSDAFYYAACKLAAGTPPADVAVVPSGCVRDTFTTGSITVEEVFKSYSLGTGPDRRAGYPLIGVYLTGDELLAAAEIDASLSDFMKSARLYASGITYTFNPNRMILNKVTRAKLIRQPAAPWQGAGGTAYEEIRDDELYFVVSDLYTGQMLKEVEKLSYGILSVTPKDKNGKKIEDLESCILYDKDGNEIKAWEALAEYMLTFEKEGETRVMPAYYKTMHGRKLVDNSKRAADLLKNPSKYAVIICTIAVSAGAITVVGAAAAARCIRKRIRLKR
ncbi:Trifunctional nucleotide phosphoesterase protein YfkN precursor [uncultured Roseburia sp.]|uniref:Bifunctional metallophosphatase/5'-nucleotidase n=1 Tax=Brotonthovivens ammoniilytica TaxID=2981725 RepID=A0ABT2TI21_9FIRM|nr:bifunctional UDP-sugar hydrolase/5'-nucleotidase [Brotonthovivens ammoniilytica]MCU6761858.1 bifunctional metallophosphatase/5'-nucleotidase [Brotonthovivens ammoniilytica]SCI48729.1 Trifunctional nucleotide phosphoesterase protein YfkN precursor [uncultured Roseburia sp.]